MVQNGSAADQVGNGSGDLHPDAPFPDRHLAARRNCNVEQ
jgi:hypothetical protein